MRIIVVGGGLAGTLFSKNLQELDSGLEIDIFDKEDYLYYPRPNLIEFLAGNMPFERLFPFSPEWYQEKNIRYHQKRTVTRIFSDSDLIELEDGNKEKFDALLLANGSYAFIPPIKGADKQGVFSLRTLDDALGLLEFLKGRRRVTVIGGGLLGLEIARALKSRGAEIEVIEFFPYLLGRQLDQEGAAILKDQIEKMGIKVRLGAATEELRGAQEIKTIRLKSGEELDTDMAVIAAGVRSHLELAKEAGLETDKGIVVDDYLSTSHPKIFAAGDNLEHRGRLYGIIPASFQQARIAAHNILGQKMKYEGTVPSNTLKVMGVSLTSVGLVNPEKGTCEEYRRENREEGIYKKIVLQNGILVGAIWMGTKQGVNEISQMVTQKMDVSKWKDALLQDDFDFSLL